MNKIAFFGSAEFALPTLELLAKQKDLQVVLVVSKPDKPAGRGMKMTPTPLKAAAERLKLPVTTELPDPAELEKLGINKIVVVAYGKLIPAAIFDRWPCINLHPSLLPKYRGASPLQSALLNGEKSTGVSTMLIAQEMDAGDILLQQEIPLNDEIDLQELHDVCARAGADLVLKTLQSDLEKIRRKQDPAQATFCKKIENEDSKIIPGEHPVKIHNRVRAITGYLEINNKRIKILKTKLVYNSSQLGLEIITVQPEGKKPMSYQDYLKGNQEIKL